MNRFAAFVTLVCCFTTSVSAQGPDVIVGEIPDVSNYAGPVWAIGTTSCNLGDTPLTWIDCSSGPQCNVHPVISQNIYRLHGGRFEQIGQAWLKHGFCALQGTVCSSCTPGGNCDALFPGCSDPYSSGLNGSQGGLGPKSEVNAATGAFPYPWLNNGCGSSTTACKRLQAAAADISSATYPGALYFVSSMYVQPEDAAAGNDDNNESYRRVTITGDDIALAGSTMRESPGIFAWRDNGGGIGVTDPSVNLVPVDVPGDGRFWLGSKATDLGGGQWHYQYAIQNLNSDRSGQSFSVPLPAGAVVTNVAFHDVAYHSGEPYVGTDWTSSVTGTAVTWASQTHAQNVNANALRWDTIYNFRFDCNIAPAGENATLGLFKPGTPTAMSVLVVAPSTDGTQHPLNDDCSGALTVTNGPAAFSSVGATTDGPNEPGACNFFSYTQIDNDVWFYYIAQCDGTVDVRTCGSTFDTKIAVYNGIVCPTTASAIACNDDSATCGSGSLQSQLTFNATTGTAYLIRLGGYQGATGSGTLTVADNCGPQAPDNDACADADWIAAGVIYDGTTLNSSNDGTATCGSSASSPDVWYRYRPLTTGSVTVTTCDSVNPTYDTVVSVHTGTCGALTQVGCNDDTGGACGLRSTVTLSMTAGTTYYIRVAGFQNATGNFRIRVTGGGGVIPPANDDCANRAGIALGSTPFVTTGAVTDGIAHALCNQNGSNAITNDVWYNFPAQASGSLTVSTCGSANFNTRIAVYDGAGCSNLDARLLACNDNGSGCGTTSLIQLSVTQGNNYTIRLGGTSGATGSGTLVLSMDTGTAPVITAHPQNTTVCSGTPASFSVTATGTAPLTYQWRRNNVNLSNVAPYSGVDTPTLSINPATAAQAGNFDVVVSNSLGSATSNVATLTVNATPGITTQPGNQTLCAGGSASLTVAASGTAPLSYQWRRGTTNLVNGGNISGATTATLTLNPVAAGDAATNYNCVVTNLCGSATSNNASLTVNTAPSVTGQPGNQTVCAGGLASFTVAASGTAPLSYQWRRGTTNLVNGGNISGATTATLTINPVAAGDAGTNYNCVVTNLCGSATSNNASLTVNAAPAVTGQPSNQTVCAGGSASFTVTVSGAAPLSYQWRRGTTNLVNGGNVSGATTATLTINPVGAGDAATNYNCVVTNLCGSATSNNASLTMNAAPAITGQPGNQTACAGASTSFSVTASGAAPLSYQWRRGTTNLVNGGNVSGATTATLTINPVGAGDAATNYNCVVTNACGSATSSNASLTVNTAAAISVQPPANQSACSGDSISFSITATGTAPLSYQWRRGTTNLTNGGNISGATTPTLTINPVAPGDAASNYNCVVTNLCGSATSNNAALSVNAGPAITSQPGNVGACEGVSVSFIVAASGTAPITYQWRRGTTNLVNGGNISGATTPTLTINPVGPGDVATNYNCVVTNPCGSTTSVNASLTVGAGPAITGQPANQSACSGASASFSVTASGSGTLSYQWRRGTTNLFNGGNISGATTATLTINPVASGDAASDYNCVVTNPCGSTTSGNAALSIDAGPAITDQPANQTVNAGASASFTVAASGTAPLAFQWRRGTTNLADGGNISGATTATLTINPAAEADEATDYNCVVTNRCGSTTSNNASLTVNSVPCPGDVNGDNQVELGDLAILLANFGTPSGATLGDGDLDGDGDVDLDDLAALLAQFGSTC